MEFDGWICTGGRKSGKSSIARTQTAHQSGRSLHGELRHIWRTWPGRASRGEYCVFCTHRRYTIPTYPKRGVRSKVVPLDQHPKLIFDHEDMISAAKHTLRTKAALYPILFELLPEKFTIPQIASLYECVYNIELDKRNFSRKLLSSGLLIKLNEKDKENSRKG